MGFFDKLRSVFGGGGSASDVQELLELLEREAPTEDESRRLQALAKKIASSAKGDRERSNELLATLVPRLDAPHPQSAGLVAVFCGMLVEHGANVDLLTKPLLARARKALEEALRLVEASREVDEVEEYEGVLLGKRWIAEEWIPKHLAIDPVAVQSFVALEHFFMALVVVLSSSATLLASVEARALIDLMDALGIEGQALDRLSRVPLNETWLVLDPARDRGVEMTVSGVADAFQVYALVHQALHEAGAWPDAPDADVVAVADGTGPRGVDASYIPPFALFRFGVVDAAKTVPDNGENVMDWYSNSAIPAELARHEGKRVAIVGVSSMQMIFIPRRWFPSLAAHVKVSRELSKSELDTLWKKLAEAPRPEHPTPFVGWR